MIRLVVKAQAGLFPTFLGAPLTPVTKIVRRGGREWPEVPPYLAGGADDDGPVMGMHGWEL